MDGSKCPVDRMRKTQVKFGRIGESNVELTDEKKTMDRPMILAQENRAAGWRHKKTARSGDYE
jgi:hypothetical protein